MTFRFWKFSWNLVRKKPFCWAIQHGLFHVKQASWSEITAPNSISRCDLSRTPEIWRSNGPSFPLKNLQCAIYQAAFFCSLSKLPIWNQTFSNIPCRAERRWMHCPPCRFHQVWLEWLGLVVCWWIVGSCGRRVGLLAEINWNSMHQWNKKLGY